MNNTSHRITPSNCKGDAVVESDIIEFDSGINGVKCYGLSAKEFTTPLDKRKGRQKSKMGRETTLQIWGKGSLEWGSEWATQGSG